MKNNKYLKFYLVTVIFFVFFPKLAVIPFSSFIPKIIFGLTLICLYFTKKIKKIRFDYIVLVLSFYIFSLLITYFIGENDAVLKILLYAIFFLISLEAGVSVGPYLKSSAKINIEGYYFYIILLIFITLPLSVILQYFFPSIAYYYYQLVLYDEVLGEGFQAIDGKYSGLTGGIGTGGSTALASMLILFETIKFYFFNATRLSKKLLLTLFQLVYLVSIVMCGTAGLIMAALYFIAIYLFSAATILAAFWRLILLFAIGHIILFFILPIVEIKGISYFKVLIEEGFDAFLTHRSAGALIDQYQDLPQNFEWVVDNAGIFGNSNAIGYYDITDIGFLNEINLIGLSGFLLFNIYLFSCLIVGFKKNYHSFFCKENYALRCALVSVTLYSFILQFKEFSSLQGNGPQALSLVILILLFGIRKDNIKLL